MDNGWALMEFSEDSKNRESFPGQGQKMLQVGDTMEEVGKENEGMISELPSDFLRWWELLQTCLEGLFGLITKFNKEICPLPSEFLWF